MSSSSHANNRKNDILVLGKDFTRGINGTTSMQKDCIKSVSLNLH